MNKALRKLPTARNTRPFIVAALLVLIAVSLALTFILGCSRNQKSDHPKLVYWSANNQDEINLAREIVDEWNRLHPEIPVDFQPVPEGESSEEIILAAVVAKTTPDIYSNMWPGDVETYVRAGKLVCLNAFSDFDSVVNDRYAPDISNQMKSGDGKVYQLLWKTNPIMMFYNKKMFSQVGFEHPPETYSEYLDAAKKMTRDTDSDGYVDRWVGVTEIRARWRDRLHDFYPLYIAASGGKTLLDNGEIAFDNPCAVGVFRFFQTLYANGYFPREITNVGRDFVLQNLAASRITGPWEVVRTEKFKPEGFEYDFIHVPVPDDVQGPYYTYMDPKSIVIFRNTRYPEDAWKFIKHMVSRQNDLKLLQTTTQLPLRKTVLEDPLFITYFERNPKIKTFAEQARFIKGVDTTPALKEIFDAISQEFEACVVYSAKTPEKAVRDAAERSRLVLE